MSRSTPVPETPSNVVPRALLVGTPLVPRTALPGSSSETLARSVNKSSYGIGAVSRTVCPQKFVLDQTSSEKVIFTPRSQQGIHAHKQFLKGHVKKEYEQLKPSTDEEEAAVLFTYLPRRLNNLIEYGIVGEFPVFGYLYGRPFTGSIDEVTLDRSRPNPTILVNELKTTATGHVKEWLKRGATRQATLYLYFLRQMMDKTRPFDFNTYFRARGLDPSSRFGSEYAMELLDRMSPAMRKSTSSIDPQPINLCDLGERWNHFIQGLPEFIFPDYTFLTVVRLSQISKVAGFAKFGRPTTTQTPYNIKEVLEDVRSLLYVLDGHKAMHGPPAVLHGLCNACGHKDTCTVRPDPPQRYSPETRFLWPMPTSSSEVTIKRTAADDMYESWAAMLDSEQVRAKKAALKRSSPLKVDKPDEDSSRRLRIRSKQRVQQTMTIKRAPAEAAIAMPSNEVTIKHAPTEPTIAAADMYEYVFEDQIRSPDDPSFSSWAEKLVLEQARAKEAALKRSRSSRVGKPNEDLKQRRRIRWNQRLQYAKAIERASAEAKIAMSSNEVITKRAPTEATIAAANMYEWWAEKFAPEQARAKEAALAGSKPLKVDQPKEDAKQRQRQISLNLKVQHVLAANQQRALRQQLESRREALLQFGDSDRFTGVVPYSTPTSINLANIVPANPNDKRGRLRRRVGALQIGSLRRLPKHDIYSSENLATIPKFDKATWVYQFDTKPDAENQAQLSVPVDPLDAGQPTDAEREAEEREARRAKRRREREGHVP